MQKTIKRFKGGSPDELRSRMSHWIKKHRDSLENIEYDYRINTTGTIMFVELTLEVFQNINEDTEIILPYLK